MKCQKCGYSLPEDSEFCQYCGACLASQTGSETAATPAEHPPIEPVSEIISESTSIDSKAETVNEKHNFCKICGAIIDPSTKKCSNCNKQYFNAKKVVPIILLFVLLIGSISLNVIQYFLRKEAVETAAAQTTKIEALEQETSAQKTIISTQKAEINSLKDKTDELEDRNFALFSDLYFYKEYAAIVPDNGGKLYHIYGCEDCDTSYFWIYNIDAAEQYGYYPCPKCY